MICSFSVPPWSPFAMDWKKESVSPTWFIIWHPEDVPKEMHLALSFGVDEGQGEFKIPANMAMKTGFKKMNFDLIYTWHLHGDVYSPASSLSSSSSTSSGLDSESKQKQL